MVRQATNETIMKLSQKVFLFHLNQQDDSNSSFIKSLNCLCHHLPLDHVMFQEAEAADEQISQDKPALILRGILSLDEMRHKHSMGHNF